MKHRTVLFAALLGGLLPLAAAETAVDPATVKNGENPPELVSDAQGNILRFRPAADKGAAAAELPGKFDFSKGVRIALDYRDEADQNNPYPRLFETGFVSLHLVAPPDGKGNKQLKALIIGGNPKEYAQITLPSRFRKGQWNSLVFEYLPEAKCFTLALNDGTPAAESVEFPVKAQNLTVLLGATALKGSIRGFAGEIRNLRITAPYNRKIDFKAPAPVTPPEINGVPVRHLTVSAVSNRHHAFPGVTKLPNGDLAAVFREGADHVCPYGRICIVYSKDGGKNWSAPVSIADTASDERDPSIQTLPDGRVLVTYGGWNSWMAYDATKNKFPSESAYIQQAGPEKFGGSRFIFSSDNGESWSKPVKVPAFAPHGPFFFEGNFYYPTLAGRDGKRQVDFYRGNADATKWEKLSTVGESEAGNVSIVEVFEEPHAAALPDGTFVTAIRVPSDGFMRISSSGDRGKTWSEPVKTPVRGFPQHLLPLKDGRLLATYGYRYRPFGVRACVSRDGGKTWDMEHEMVLQNNGINGDLGYPVSIELDNGEVLTVYYMNSKEHDNCFIEGAVYRP